jgi:hypothetical protein
MGVIAERFNLPGGGVMPPAVKDADNRILLTERAALMSATKHPWVVDGLEPLRVSVRGLAPMRASRLFLDALEAYQEAAA